MSLFFLMEDPESSAIFADLFSNSSLGKSRRLFVFHLQTFKYFTALVS